MGILLNHPTRIKHEATLAIEECASLAKLMQDHPDATEVLFGGLHAERRQKPSYPNADGTTWGSLNTIIIKDSLGRIVAELPELGEAS